MRTLSYTLAVAASFVAAAAGLGAVAFHLQPLQGDLTRIGRLDEGDFGPNSSQTKFVPLLFDKEPGHLAHDIIVLGDSFSLNGLTGWVNTVAARTGASVAVLNAGEHLWEDVIKRADYREHPPAVFIYESVERHLRDQVGRPAPCDGWEGSSPEVKIDRPLRAFQLEPDPRPTRTPFSEINTSYAFDFLSEAVQRRLGMSSEVVIAPLRRPLFSSGMSQTLLFYRLDLEKAAWREPDFAAIACGYRKAQAEIQRDGHTLFLALPVPDKLTVYWDDLLDPRYPDVRALGRADLRGVNVVNVLEPLKHAVERAELDVYLPNDTHLSSGGHALVAEAVLKALVERKVLAPER